MKNIHRMILSFDGLISRKKMAKILKMKTEQIEDRFRAYPARISGFTNGLRHDFASQVSPSCPYILTSGVKFCLWIDIYETMDKSTIDPLLVQCIEDMVRFQLWIHAATKDDLRGKIWTIITQNL